MDTPRVKVLFGAEKFEQALAANKLSDPNDVAESYHSVHLQPMVR